MTAAATLAATTLVAPTPAAAIPGLILVDANSTSTDGSGSPKSVIAQCPPGTILIGGGGFVTGGPATAKRTVLVGMHPVVSYFGVGYRVIGAEDEIGTDGGWMVEARALCAPAPPGLEYVWGHSGTGSMSSRSVAVSCPGRKQVLGTGGMTNGSMGQLGLRSVVPTPNPTRTGVSRSSPSARDTRFPPVGVTGRRGRQRAYRPRRRSCRTPGYPAKSGSTGDVVRLAV